MDRFIIFSSANHNYCSRSKKQLLLKLKYIIASDSSFAPFVFQNSSNQFTGIDMDLIKAIAKDQGFEIEITNPGFDAAISAVQAGQADGIIAGMSVTDARKATFDFSESYYTAKYYPWCQRIKYHCFL